MGRSDRKNGERMKHLRVEKNKVYAEIPCKIHLLLDEYKVQDSDYMDEEDIKAYIGDEPSFSIPGTFEILFPEIGESQQIFLPYNINLAKTPDIILNSKELIIEYEAGDLIFGALIKKKETNIDILNSLFENRVKYLRGHPEKQLEAIWGQLAGTTNYGIHHLSIILSLLYATMEDGEETLIRHTKNQNYDKGSAIGTKVSSHVFNMGAQSLNYGYGSDAMMTSIFKNRTEKLNFDDSNEILSHNIDPLSDRELREIARTPANSLTTNIQRGQAELNKGKLEQYTDLENVISSRFDLLQDQKTRDYGI